jgi:spore germination protein YaaH
MSNWTSRIGAWIYPGSPACNADEEYSDGRTTYILKPEYYQVDTGGAGTINLLTVAGAGCNAYSVANAASVKQYSSLQFMTVSCGTGTNMNALCSNATKRTNAINTLLSTLNVIQFTGVELDWEGFSGWTAPQYANFLIFISELSTALHASGYQLMVDGPPMIAAVDAAYGQNLFQFRYEDMVPYCDYIVMLAYDYQYDYGAGEPVSPTTFVQACCDWMIAKVVNLNQIVIGMPSYGYHGLTGGYSITIDTYTESTAFTGFGTATRDADYEMEWTNAGTSYVYQDTSGLNSKRTVIEAKGIRHISVWHLGGNQWFTGTEPSNPSYSNTNLIDVASVTNLSSLTI